MVYRCGLIFLTVHPFGEGTDHEPYRTVDGYFSDLAWWNEPDASIPCLPRLVRLDYQLFEVLRSVA